MKKTRLITAGILAAAVCPSALAGGGKPIAGVLIGASDAFWFESDGGQVLFAELKSDYYQTRGRMESDHSQEETADAESCSDSASTGGCTDGGDTGGCSDGGDTGGCSDGGDTGCSGGGGPGDLCLQVLAADGTMICWAGRPARPGWQRDPRLACPISAEGVYWLRVARAPCGPGGHETVTAAETGTGELPPRPYLLDVALLDQPGTGGRVKDAIDASKDEF